VPVAGRYPFQSVTRPRQPGGVHPAPKNPTASQAAKALAAELDRLRADFPEFWIWPESTGSGVRFVARSQRPGLNPHTVVTADLAELRAALGQPDRPR
jgi:hypothetical protein